MVLKYFLPERNYTYKQLGPSAQTKSTRFRQDSRGYDSTRIFLINYLSRLGVAIDY